MPERPRRPEWTALAVTGWLAAVLAATALTIGAVSLIEAGLFGGSTAPLSEDEVAAALSAASSAPAPAPTPTDSAAATPPPTGTVPAPTPTPTPTDSAAARPAPATPAPQPAPTTPAPANPSAAVAFSRAGNTVVARCAGGAAQIVSWTPAQGYHVSNGVNQHGDEAEVEFESEDHKVRIRVACAGAQPTAAIEEN